MAEDNKESDATTDPGNNLHAVNLMAAAGGYDDFVQRYQTSHMAVYVSFGDNKVSLNTAPTKESLQESAAYMAKLPLDQQFELYKKAVEQIYGPALTEEAKLIEARETDPGLKSPLINVNMNWRSFITDKALKIEKENETDVKIEHDEVTEFSQFAEAMSITQYATQMLTNAITNKVGAKAVGTDKAFTDIKDPSTKGMTLALNHQGYTNAKCPISDINDEDSYFTDDALSRLNSQNIGLIEAGATVGNIEDAYWTPDSDDTGNYYHSKHRSSLVDKTGKPYHCLPNRGGYENLSLVGLASVGAMGFSNNYNGTDPNIGAIQSAILSVRLLAVQGGVIQTYQIESAKYAIHNSDAKAKLAAKNITLIQDDQVFSDVIVSFGTYGVITHAYITLLDAFYLDMYRESVTFTADNQQAWIDLYNKINSDSEVYQAEYWFNPYQDTSWPYKQDCTMSATYYKKTPKGYIPNTLAELQEYGGANKNIDKYPLSTVLFGAFTTQGISNLKHLLHTKGEGTLAAALNKGLQLVMIAEHADPNTKKQVTTLTLSCVEALDFGTANLVPTNTSGNAFPVGKSTTVIENYIKFLQSIADSDYLTVTSPLALRFSAQSFGSVSCAGEYPVGWVEQPILTVGNGNGAGQSGYNSAHTNSISTFDKTVQFFQESYDGKIHWGLYFDDNAKYWEHISDANKTSFFEKFKSYNKDKTFSNDFTQVSGMEG